MFKFNLYLFLFAIYLFTKSNGSDIVVGTSEEKELPPIITRGCVKEHLLAISKEAEIRCEEDVSLIPEFGICEVHVQEKEFVYVCVERSWEISTGTNLHVRQKRFLDFLLAVLPIVLPFFTTVYCTSTTGNKDCQQQAVQKLEAPYYTKDSCPPPDLQKEHIAGSKKNGVVVRWTPPVASDTDGHVVSNEQTCCSYKRGERFPGLPDEGLEHTITYTAKDDHGLTATCTFYFVVKYLTCEEPTTPQNGRKVSCPDGYVYGGQCTFECNAGYRLDVATATCQEDQTWDQLPTCTKLICPAPFELNHGQVICEDSSHTFDTQCDFVCDDGFKLNGPRKMICQADQTWSVRLSQVACEDEEPPVILCQTPQVFYADRGTFSVVVVWTKPTATDNVDASPVVEQISGPQRGERLSEGHHYVKYRAIDSSGNSLSTLSECIISLEVKVVKCSSGPADALDNSRFLMYNCSSTTFFNGVSCKLGCDLNLPLNGTEVITCEREGTTEKGVWKWGSGNQPFCQVVQCPTLKPPKHGAFTTNSVSARPLHVMYCNKGYDISSVGAHFTGRLSCQDSGEWYPLDAFPDCIVPTFPWLNLPAELYYQGDCNDAATKEKLKNHALEYLNGVQADIDDSICKKKETCKVDNVIVVCGSSKRKRRTINNHIRNRKSLGAFVYWDIKVVFDQGNRTTSEVYNEILGILQQIEEHIQSDVDSGDLDVDGFILENGAFQTASQPTLECDDGYKRETGSVVCKPCPAGTYLNSTTGNCEFCNVGQYMETEGAKLCDACPDGYSTLTSGAKLRSQCLKLCSPGFSSFTSMEPCSACPVGFYQADRGRTSCISCPYGLTTNGTNSTSVTFCKSFDLAIGRVDQRKTLGSFSVNGATFLTLSIWLKLSISDSLGAFSLYVSDNEEDVMMITLSNTLSIGGTGIETDAYLSPSRWSHLVMSVDISARRRRLYINSVLKIDESNLQMNASKIVSSGTVDLVSNATDIFLSGFMLYPRELSNSELTALSQSCVVITNDEIFSMVDVLDSALQGIAVITPSVCDAVDECESDPCEGHKCINHVDGFQCVCHGGMSGTQCNIPPDYCADNECDMGDCLPGNGSYTCSCKSGYTGTLCDKPPVNGGWSNWVEWSGCDVTCGGGRRTRTRSCNNPPPGYLGNDCMGNDQEKESCNQMECPECAVLRREFGTTLSCSDNSTTGLKECTMTCIQGKALPNGQKPFEKYSCGASTNYTWVPINKTPTCVDLVPPDILDVETKVVYSAAIPATHQSAVTSSVEEKFSNFDCIQSGKCSLSATVGLSDNRRRRSVTSTVTLQISIELTTTGELAIADYLANGTETAAMKELLDALKSISELTDYIQNGTESIFEKTVDGVKYSLEKNTADLVLKVSCADGYAGADGLCGICAAGTRLEDFQCIDCEKGTYQPLTGQRICTSCPDGYTTATYGATDVSECNVPSTSSESTTDDSSNSVMIIIIVVVCVVTSVVAVVVVVILVWKKTKRQPFRKTFSLGSLASISKVRPDSSCSMTADPGNTCFNTGSLRQSSTLSNVSTLDYNRNPFHMERERSVMTVQHYE